MSDKSDHDLLIELNTKTEIWHKEVRGFIENHVKEDVIALDRLERIVSAAHKRLDGFGSMKDKILGGSAVVMFILSIATLLMKVYKG